ncbi:putative membrane protein [Cryptosporangium arvum DSM 44712]|uniref:Putative membrane protein n=1 Tax=Cryptosporangium arvum DSM 44712 TaxID=927661 RepID=A0A010YGI2_9ACTN|nr:PrsW family glutamic-type intramembrane protease [Cryptosporangium arvum]EXG79350.1 putative membrane protein [Cryptosporangium arvum DSM 44712]
MQWRRDLWLAILTIGTVAFVVGERILSTSDEPGLVTPVLVIGAMTAPMAFYAACRGLHFTVPTWVVVASMAIAAALGSVMSGLLGYYALADLGPVATVAVSLVEESVTLLVPLAALFALPTRRASDGLLVGAAAGGGFAVAQTVGYLVTLPSVVGPAAHDVLVRGLLAPAAQLAWGAITALALWLAAQEHWNGRSLRRLVLAITGVVALHALWEGVHGVPGRLLLTVLSGVLLGWVVVRTVARRGVSTRVLSRSGVSSARVGAGGKPGSAPAKPGSAGSHPGGAGAHPGGAGTRPDGSGARPDGAGVGSGGAGAKSGRGMPGGAGVRSGGAGVAHRAEVKADGAGGAEPGGAGVAPRAGGAAAPVEGREAVGAPAGTVAGGTVAGGTVAGGTVAGGTVAGGTVAGGTVAGGTVAGGTVAAGTVAGGATSGMAAAVASEHAVVEAPLRTAGGAVVAELTLTDAHSAVETLVDAEVAPEPTHTVANETLGAVESTDAALPAVTPVTEVNTEPLQAPLTGLAEGEWEQTLPAGSTDIPAAEHPAVNAQEPRSTAPPTPKKPRSTAPRTTPRTPDEPLPTAPRTASKPLSDAPRTAEKPHPTAPRTADKPLSDAPRTAKAPRSTAPRTADKPSGTKKPNGARKPGPAAPRAKKSNAPRPASRAATTEPNQARPTSETD